MAADLSGQPSDPAREQATEQALAELARREAERQLGSDEVTRVEVKKIETEPPRYAQPATTPPAGSCANRLSAANLRNPRSNFADPPSGRANYQQRKVCLNGSPALTAEP